MNKKTIWGIVGVLVIAAAAIGTVVALKSGKSNKGSGSKQTSTTMAPHTSSSDSSQASSTPTATNSVAIQGFAFSPADITVKVGTTVTWTNQDSTAHTVTETDGKTGPDSGTLAQSKTYSFTYAAAGTYSYHCAFHGDMVGTVTVTE